MSTRINSSSGVMRGKKMRNVLNLGGGLGSEKTVKVLAHLLDEDIGPKCESSTAFSSEQRLCLALSFYAVGSFQWSIGGGKGAGQATMCRVISRVSEVLATHADNIIRFCVDDEILYQVSEGFFASAGEYCFCMKCNYINNVVHMFVMKCKWIF